MEIPRRSNAFIRFTRRDCSRIADDRWIARKRPKTCMTKLEEEYKDNPNLVFMSVSIDQPQDEQKWKDMVAEKQMKGIQLFAGSKADDIAKPYKVKGIPRFILVRKDGKLIAGEAPRPSSDDIRPLLKKALAQ